jgi:hypothetical protein
MGRIGGTPFRGHDHRMHDGFDRPVQSGPSRPSRSWRKGLLTLLVALALQAGLLGLALMIGVMTPERPEKARVRIPEGSRTRQRELRQQLERDMARLDRMQAESLQQLMQPMLEATRPELAIRQPQLQASLQGMGAMLPLEGAFAGATGTVDADIADALPMPEPVAFLGETMRARRIVLLLDVSGSVKSKMERAGLSMEALRAEVLQFIDQLGPNHLFGIIQFTRNWLAFRKELVPATGPIREEAKAWMQSAFRTTGTSGRNWTRGSPNGIEGVLATAFAMDPEIDEIFLLGDADFQRTPPGGGGQDVPWAELRQVTRELQANSIGDTRLRVLCFHPPPDALPDLRAWVRENGDGTVRIRE